MSSSSSLSCGPVSTTPLPLAIARALSAVPTAEAAMSEADALNAIWTVLVVLSLLGAALAGYRDGRSV